MTLLNPRFRGALLLLAGLAGLIGLVVSLNDAPSTKNVDPADLLPVDQAFILSAEAPTREVVAVRWVIAEGYYLYRHAKSVQVLEGGLATGPLQLPPGKQHTDEFFGAVETYRTALETTLPIRAEAAATALRLRVKYQGCADLGICYPPQTRDIELPLPAAVTTGPAPVTNAPNLLSNTLRGNLLDGNGRPSLTSTGPAGLPLPETEAFRVEAIADGPNRLLVRFDIAPGYYLYRDKIRFAASSDHEARITVGEWPPARTITDPYFGEQAVFFDEALVPLAVIRTQDGVDTLRLEIDFMGCQENGICYPPLERRLSVELPANGSAGDSHGGTSNGTDSNGTSLFTALLFALLGGLILNLMPCVLPILSLKVLSLAGNGESPAKARIHALWYTAGVVLSFAALGALALALREAGLALGWGFQLQQPAVVGGLALIMFAVGLALSGVFHVGGGLAGLGQSLTQKSGPAGDFFTGVLAVVVAAPCMAPFMGAALAYAFTAPTTFAIGVFVALGLGLALPFLAIGFLPRLARLLPKPGAWMETFKQALAFPMYLTAVWLVWVLAKQRGADAAGWLLLGAVLLALGLWVWETARFRSTVLRVFALVIAAGGVAVLWPVHQLTSARTATIEATQTGESTQTGETADTVKAADGSLPWSPERFAALRAEGRVVFVNMTADWCITCKANERTVLAAPTFTAALQAANAIYLKGDWTEVDPTITAYLQEHGAVGVPFYAVYPAGGGPPQVLPNLLTTGIVEKALARAAAGGTAR